eukprot:79989-Chlamydomonas_euryale.AAC.8
MLLLIAARQRGSSSGLGAVTKGTPLRTVLSHRTLVSQQQEPYPARCSVLANHPTKPHQPLSKKTLRNRRPIRHPDRVSLAALRICMNWAPPPPRISEPSGRGLARTRVRVRVRVKGNGPTKRTPNIV